MLESGPLPLRFMDFTVGARAYARWLASLNDRGQFAREMSLFCLRNHEHEWLTATYPASAPALIFSKISFDCTPFK
jgi:hypothetical protein